MTKLTDLQKKVVFEGKTEPPFHNLYWNEYRKGVYCDVVSGKPLFSSRHKFDSKTGWPSFYKSINDDEIITVPDFSLGMKRIEIKSASSNAHLGHLFYDGPVEFGGKRYCVNSAALQFIPNGIFSKGFKALIKRFSKDETIVLAGGCFWGMEKMLLNLKGVLKTRVGYCGGLKQNPTYDDVRLGDTGHAESVEVMFNPREIELEDLLLYFFRIHDPITLNRQGNDVGSQYRSAIFYFTEKQKNIAENTKLKVQISGVFKDEITTEITKITDFWQAEEYHQQYLIKNPTGYSCHFERKNWIF